MMFFSEVWRTRWLFVNFLQREISGRYIGSISGLFWVLLNPLALLVIYWFVFTMVFKVSVAELQGRDFIEFVAVGLWPWLAFQEALQRGAMSVQGASGLIKKVSFPHELLVYSSIVSTYLIHLSGFLFVLILMGLTGREIHFLALPAAMLILFFQVLFTCGLAMLLAALQVFVRDVEHFLSPLMMIWFYATPVLYTSNMVPQQMRGVMAMNPMATFIGAVRDAMQINPMATFIGAVRDAMLHGVISLSAEITVLAAGSVGLFLVARLVFRRLSPHFEDFL